MRSFLATGLSLFLAVQIVAAKEHALLRLHMEANLHDTNAFASSVRAKFSGREVAIEQMPRISERDVVAFYPYQAKDGTFGALFQLDDHGKVALEALSIERRGNLLFVFVNNRCVTQLQVDRRISDGKIYVASGLTEADIRLMKKEWRVIGQKKKH